MRQTLACRGWVLGLCFWATALLAPWLGHSESPPEAARPADPAQVLLITVSDSINPGTADYIMDAIEVAESSGAPYLVLQLDTPGGLLSATRQIVQKMLNSRVPIVVYVGPRGAHAGSAGALITFAADVAAMAPGTNIGAAHPVVPGNQNIDETMRKKMAQDTAAFAESLAKAKGRSTEWARKAVLESESIIAETAVTQNVVDLLAQDVPDLLRQLPGYQLRVPKGGITQLASATVGVEKLEMTIRHRLVSFFADPNLAYMILSLGGLCLWVELTNPGLIVPGVIGVVCIILSLISFQLLPISYGALAFILLGMAMVVAELFLPTYGLLGVAGIAAFIFGSLFLMDTGVPEFQISLALILPTAAVLAASAFALGWMVMRSRGLRVRSGAEGMIGEFGEAREEVTAERGLVFVQGELWSALTEEEPIPKGTLVVVREVRGMVLVVARQR